MKNLLIMVSIVDLKHIGYYMGIVDECIERIANYYLKYIIYAWRIDSRRNTIYSYERLVDYYADYSYLICGGMPNINCNT